jgi:hypothetical protein
MPHGCHQQILDSTTKTPDSDFVVLNNFGLAIWGLT